MCTRIVSSGMQCCVVKIFILHGAARRHFHYALGHLWGGALISVPNENTRPGGTRRTVNRQRCIRVPDRDRLSVCSSHITD